MPCNRVLALLPAVCLAVAVCGCSRPSVAGPGGDSLSAAEADPIPHSANEANKGTQAENPKDAEGAPFHFPEDAGGVLLAKVLTPVDSPGPLNNPNPAPRRAIPAPSLDTPTLSLPLPPSQAPPPPTPGERTRKSPTPHLVVEEVLGLGRGDPEPPQPRSFYVGDRVRIPSVDVNEPIPLPLLAQPTTDRAPLDDPTADASTTAVLAAPMPQRAKPVPYFRVTLPDPFDYRRPVNLPTLAEDDHPRTGTVHPPKP